MIGTQIPISHAIDIDDLNYQSRHKIYQKETRIFPLIQKFQQPSCDIDKNAYKPEIISIGPYHNGSSNLKENEKMEYDCRKYILQFNQELKLEHYIEAINRLEKQVRSSYADDIQMKKKTFVKMLLLEGCFLLNTLHGLDGIVPPVLNFNTSVEMKSSTDEKKDESVIDIECTQVEPNIEDGGNSKEIYKLFNNILLRDMLLLENQIPLSVLMKIYELVTGGRSTSSLLVENVVRSMENMPEYWYPKANQEHVGRKEFHHFNCVTCISTPVK